VKYKLKRPVTVGSETLAELNLREEVCAGDLRGVKLASLGDPTADDLLKLIARLSGRHDVEIAKLHPVDFLELSAAVVGFFGAGLETGTEP
jgi:hypothetical protein